MTTKRTKIDRAPRARLTPEMRRKAERLVELEAAHVKAIRGADEAFYTDGRHEELQALMIEVYPVLGIRPWMDADRILQAALA